MRRICLALGLLVALEACVHHALPSTPPRTAHRVAAISDLHLGDSRSLLEDSAGRAVVLDAVSRAVHEDLVDVLVLNGDVLELALASSSDAFSITRDVFRGLAAIDGLQQVVVIVGNHDHRLFEDIPGETSAKLGREYDSSTPFHSALGDSAGRLRVTLVYPDWALPVAGGNVHFTHGHYFDPLTVPAFAGISTLEELELANRPWLALVNASGRGGPTRDAWLKIYDTSQRGTAALEKVSGRHSEPGKEGADRDQSRIGRYLTTLIHDDHAVAVVTGHTHHAGGLMMDVPYAGHTVPIYDTGGFVAGHRGIPIRAFLFEVDVVTGSCRMLPIDVPAELEKRAEDRAFSSKPPDR